MAYKQQDQGRAGGRRKMQRLVISGQNPSPEVHTAQAYSGTLEVAGPRHAARGMGTVRNDAGPV